MIPLRRIPTGRIRVGTLRAPESLRRGALLLALSSSIPLSAQAVGPGIDCELAMSATEEAICADPVLKRMDDDLAAAWTRARADRDVAEVLTVDQQRWLRERDACGAELACLRPAYARRLAELAETGSTFRWPGTWTRIGGSGDGGRLAIVEDTAGVSGPKPVRPPTSAARPRYRVSLDASAGANTGSLAGEAGGPGPDSLTLAAPSIAPRCRIVLHRVGRFVDVEQNDDACGAGHGVTFAGRYVPGAAPRAPVRWTLLSLGVIVQAQDDARVRALVGARDYDALVAAADTVAAGRDRDALGAQVAQLSVRGLATLQEALVMRSPQGDLWIALLDVDAQARPQLRYYSTAPDWSARLPATIDAWRQRFAEVPVRMMSMPGQPVRTLRPTHG